MSRQPRLQAGPRRRSRTSAAATVLLVSLAACGGHAARAAEAAHRGQAWGIAVVSRLAAALPRPALVAQGVSSANSAHLIRNRAWDFAQMRKVFNTVSLLPGDPGVVEMARRAGLAVILEFDYKADFFRGRDISARVRAVADQIWAARGTVSAVHVADRLDENYSASDGLRYLAATGGVLHRLVPGVPVLVNAADWELTCGRRDQSTCLVHAPRYMYETNATLDRFHRSGYVDGFTVADNLKALASDVQAAAWKTARQRWPGPFLLLATCSQVSFPDQSLPPSADATALTDSYVRAPLASGADGVALWAWHQLYEGRYFSFLNKDGSTNKLWAALMDVARTITTDSSTSRAKGFTSPSHPPSG